MSNPDCTQDTLRAKGLPEKIAFWIILAFLVGLPAVLEVAVAVRPG